MKVMFNEYHEQVLTEIDDRINDIALVLQEKEVEIPNNSFADSMIDTRQGLNVEIQHRLYTFSGKMWHVPKNFNFPSNAKLLTGWQHLIGEQPGYSVDNVNEEGEDKV